MKFFYYCFAGSHSSVIAANIHLKILPGDRVATIEEICNVKEFDRRNNVEPGIPLLIGKDEHENNVYVIGLKKNRNLGLQTIYHFLNQVSNPADWKFYDVLSEINWLTRVGGFISGNLNLPNIGRPIVARGIQKCYQKLINVVKEAKGWNYP